MTILVVGSRGNLGAEFMRIASTEFEIIRGSNSPKAEDRCQVIPSVGITVPHSVSVDLIINFANAYYPVPDYEQSKEMFNSIVGVAEAVRNFTSDKSIPVITFASYFQFAPANLQPWSSYSLLKDEASSIYSSMHSKWFEIVLRDNYGGARRNKFFDRVLEANFLGNQLDATEGRSLINLIHIQDICNYLLMLVRQIKSGTHEEIDRVELRAKDSLSLQELVALVDIIRGTTTRMNWGALPYRIHEVFQDWNSAPVPKLWKPSKSIEDYIRNFGS